MEMFKNATETANSLVMIKAATIIWTRLEQQIKEEGREPHEIQDGDISNNQEHSSVQLQQELSESINKDKNSFIPDNTLTMNKVNCKCKESQNWPEIWGFFLLNVIKMKVYSSGFSWPNHICYVHNQIYNVNIRFRECV